VFIFVVQLNEQGDDVNELRNDVFVCMFLMIHSPFNECFFVLVETLSILFLHAINQFFHISAVAA